MKENSGNAGGRIRAQPRKTPECLVRFRYTRVPVEVEFRLVAPRIALMSKTTSSLPDPFIFYLSTFFVPSAPLISSYFTA